MKDVHFWPKKFLFVLFLFGKENTPLEYLTHRLKTQRDTFNMLHSPWWSGNYLMLRFLLTFSDLITYMWYGESCRCSFLPITICQGGHLKRGYLGMRLLRKAGLARWCWTYVVGMIQLAFIYFFLENLNVKKISASQLVPLFLW